jgi:alkylation response protein AidB-like acyl-CoA dehydrogenase
MQYLQHRGLARKGHWPRELVARIAREAVTEGALINALRVEPEQGSPARGGLPATVARRTAEGWRLSGRKTYSTGSPILRWYAVWARTDESFAPEPQLGVFLVPAGLQGSRIVETWDHLGLRASGSHDLVFEDVLLPLDHAAELRPPQAWATPDLDQQAEMVVMLAALYDGVARSARAWLLDFLRSRSPGSLGAPLATLPRMQEQVGVIEGLLLTNQQLIRGLAQATDAGHLPPASDAGLVKQIVTSNAIRAVELAVELSSNHGLSRKNPLERHLRDVLCGRVHTPQDDSVHIAAGRRALGV